MIIDRKTNNKEELKSGGFQKFLINNFFGRILLKLICRRFISKLMGAFLNTRFSKLKIKKFIKAENINVDEYEVDNIKSYNAFFTRKIKDGARDIDYNENHFISPCDSKLSIYDINEDSIFSIKDSYYKINDLVLDQELAKEYIGGKALVFRLAIGDYHRYCYPDSGTKNKNKHIKGVLYTVSPIIYGKYNIFKRNSREYTILNTDHFGKIVMIEVGATLVGKIKNNHLDEYEFQKAEEKGYFEFGGSTIVLLIKNNIKLDEDLLINSKNGDETIVKYGEKIGELVTD